MRVPRAGTPLELRDEHCRLLQALVILDPSGMFGRAGGPAVRSMRHETFGPWTCAAPCTGWASLASRGRLRPHRTSSANGGGRRRLLARIRAGRVLRCVPARQALV